MKYDENIYLRWRWKKYHDVDQLNLNEIIQNRITRDKEFYFPQISDELLKDFANENFEISKELIHQYDQSKYDSYFEIFKEGKIKGSGHNLRSTFIENCDIDVTRCFRHELLQKVRQNLIYYYWWDVLSFSQFVKSIANCHFLKSTVKLIGLNKIYEYFQLTFKSKEALLITLLGEFKPDNETLEQLNWRDSNTKFDYGYLFNKDLKRSIRLIENQCRISNNEKIIGAFYNEDLLFREINRIFGNKHKVASQGSPSWLRPQRFDIFFPDLNIAIEYQGEQHFQPVDFGGKGMKIAKKQYQDNVKRDIIKKEKADKNNCQLIYVNPDYDIEIILSNIKEEINKKTVCGNNQNLNV